MKSVAMNGSPRKGGSTEILLKKVLAPPAASGWETGLNMNDPGQTIAWLGAAIHQHAGSRPPAVVCE